MLKKEDILKVLGNRKKDILQEISETENEDQKQGGCQMKTYSTDKIRNLALVGHSGCGKTTLTENLLFRTGVTNRLGRVEDGNTQSDFDKEEIARKVSIRLSLVPIEWKDIKINLIDTPGYFDFSGEVYAAMRAAEASLVVIDASSGIEVGTEKVLSYTHDIELPRIIFANKMDKDNVNIHKLIGELRDKYGKIIVPFTLPIGEGAGFNGIVDVINKVAYDNSSGERKEIPIPADMVDEVEELFGEITEIVADTDDSLMEKFFTGEIKMAVGLAIIYVVVLVVRNIIEPKVVGDQIGLHPIVILMCMFAGVQIFGLIGLFLLPIIIIILKKLNDSGKIKIFK